MPASCNTPASLQCLASRRAVLLGSMGVLASVGLSACGFQLRGAPEFAFKSLYSGFPANSSLGAEMRRSLESSGTVRVFTDVKQLPSAQVVLEVLTDQREKTVVGVNASGGVREFALRVRFKFRLRNQAGKDLIPETELVQQRDINFNESAVLSKEAEEGLLYRNMQSDIVQQVLRRLGAVRAL